MRLTSSAIEKATQAVLLARDAVKSGYYGEASDGAVSRNTPVYKSWSDLRLSVLDDVDDSLLATLQAKNWVMKRR